LYHITILSNYTLDFKGLKLDALMELKSDETTSDLSKDVRNNIGHRDLSGSGHHNSNCGVEVTPRDVTTKHNSDGQRSTDRDSVASGDDDIKEEDTSDEFNKILVQHL